LTLPDHFLAEVELVIFLLREAARYLARFAYQENRQSAQGSFPHLMSFEVLHFPLMLPGGVESCKGAQIATLAGLRILFLRIQAKLSGFESANHLLVDAKPREPVARSSLFVACLSA
jgi:hypothetical protein